MSHLIYSLVDYISRAQILTRKLVKRKREILCQFTNALKSLFRQTGCLYDILIVTCGSQYGRKSPTVRDSEAVLIQTKITVDFRLRLRPNLTLKKKKLKESFGGMNTIDTLKRFYFHGANLLLLQRALQRCCAFSKPP
jgi:hypothetical protein